jgi:hypothetical protein
MPSGQNQRANGIWLLLEEADVTLNVQGLRAAVQADKKRRYLADLLAAVMKRRVRSPKHESSSLRIEDIK